MWFALLTVLAALAHLWPPFQLWSVVPSIYSPGCFCPPFGPPTVLRASAYHCPLPVLFWCSAFVAPRDIHKNELAASLHPLHASPAFSALLPWPYYTLLTPFFRCCCLPCRKCVHDLHEERFGLIMCCSPRLPMVVWHVWVCPRHASYYVMLCGSAVCLGSLSCKRTHFANVGLLV